MTTLKIALDKSSRRIDADGRLHVDRSHISKATVNPYYGREIPGFESLGLEPDKIYRLLRDPVELERAAPTFARLPILSEHVPITVDTMLDDEEQKKLIVGAIGSDVSFNKPYLDADLCVWDAVSIAGIETDKVRELSCAYRYVPVMNAGEYEGEEYDGRMTEIQGNHLALVEVGRAGADVVVADNNPFIKESVTMRMTKLGKALFASLSAASPKLAADSALPALVGNANRKTFNKQDVKAKIIALDSDMDPNQVDNLLDAITDVEQDPKPVETPAAAVDESPADKIKGLLAGKVDEETLNAVLAALAPAPAALDEEPEPEEKQDMKGAMDSLELKLRTQFRESATAREEVREIVGDVIALDSAPEIYEFALDHMKVDHMGVTGTVALRALLKVAANAAKSDTIKPPRVAQDGNAAIAMFPHAKRFLS